MSINGGSTVNKRHLSRREFIGVSGMSAAAVLLGSDAVTGEAFARAGNDGVFEFGLVADPQYCDCPDRGTRHYRASLEKLEEAAETLNRRELAFTAQVGDMIDRREESFSEILPIFEKVRGPKFDVLGNHDFSFANSTSERAVEILDMPGRYYQFRREGWRFVVLDTNDVSFYANPEGSERYERAEELYAELKRRGAVNAQTWNGAVGGEQMSWLRDVLVGAERRGEKVIVFGHMPVYPKNVHNAWNDEVLIEVLEAHGNVVAYFNGHNHYGNYGQKAGIHYVTLHGMVERDTNAYSTVRVHPDRLEIEGYGREPDRVLRFESPAEAGTRKTEQEQTGGRS